MTSLTDLATNSASDPTPSGSDGDYDEFEPYDVSNLTFTKLHPTVAVGGTAKVLRFFAEYDEDREEYTGQGDAGLVVEDPFLAEDAVDGRPRVAVRDDDEKSRGDDMKVINLDDRATKAMPGNVGVEFDSRSFYSEMFTEWPDADSLQSLLNDDDVETDETVLKIPGSGTGQKVIRTLDVHGRGGADVVRDDNGDPILNDNGYPEVNDSLVEYHPDWEPTPDNDAPDPVIAPESTELRPDAESTRVVLMLARREEVDPDYSGDAYSWTVFGELTEDRRQELAESYAETFNENEDTEGERSASDYITTIETDAGDEVELVVLKPTAEFERSPAIRSYVKSEWGHYPTEDELSELRSEDDEPAEEDDE